MELYINNVKIFTEKPTDLKFTLMADFHGYYRSKGFNKITEKVHDLDSDIILVAGDICQGTTWQDPDNLKILESVFRGLAENKKPVFMIIGNHDLAKFNEEALRNYKSLGNIDNVYPLLNESVDYQVGDETAHISGLVTKPENYITAGGNFKTKLQHREEQRTAEIVQDIRNLKEKDPLKEENINVLLSHDPRQTRIPEVYDEAKDYDYITAGHIHNGYIPFLITHKINVFKDFDWFKILSFGLAKDRTFARGTTFGDKIFHVTCLPTSDWIMEFKGDVTKISEEEALRIIYDNKLKPVVITGGINKYNVLPLEAEILQFESTNKKHSA